MNMHSTLVALYDDMMPLCSQMTDVARALAGLGAFLWISFHIWRTLADGEPIQIIPLLRPFGIGLLIAFFPTLVLGTMNGILGTISTGTESILEKETLSVAELRKQQANAEIAEKPYLENDEEFDKELETLGWSPSDLVQMSGMFLQRAGFAIKQGIRDILSEIMQAAFDSSSLIIDTVRTFYLIVLSIMGPISFALSIWKGLESTMSFWISRYIQIYLWLPISDIFSCILARLEILMIENNITDSGGNWLYLLFMIIGTVGYFCVPTVSQWVVQSGSIGSIGRAINNTSKVTIKTSAKASYAAAGAVVRMIKNRFHGTKKN